MDLYGGNPQPLIIENTMKAIAPSTRKSAPLIRKINPVMNNR